jgi:hypothetical protein
MINGLKVHGGGSPEPCWTGFESRTKLGAAPNTSAARKKINSRESTTTTRTLTGMELHRLLCFFFFFTALLLFSLPQNSCSFYIKITCANAIVLLFLKLFSSSLNADLSQIGF